MTGPTTWTACVAACIPVLARNNRVFHGNDKQTKGEHWLMIKDYGLKLKNTAKTKTTDLQIKKLKPWMMEWGTKL